MQLDEEIMYHIRRLADGFNWQQPVRLLGVTISHLIPLSDQETDFFGETTRNRKRSAAIDALKQKFGEGIIHKGSREP